MKTFSLARALKAMITLLPLALSNQASAGAPAQWYFGVTINYIYAGQIGARTAVSFNAAIDAGTCTAYYNEMVLDPANPYYKNMMTLLTAAYLTGRPVSVFASGACASSSPTLPLMTDVKLP